MGEYLPSIAVPGQCLGEANSYVGGPGTHIKNGRVFATIAGPVTVIKEPAQPGKSSKSNLDQRATVIVSRSYVRPSSSSTSFSASNLTKRIPHDTNTTTTALPPPTLPTKSNLRFNTLPTVNSIVLARVTRIQRHQATLSILVVVDDNQGRNTANNVSSEPAGQGQGQGQEQEEIGNENDSDINALAAATLTLDNTMAEELRFQALLRREDIRAVEKDRVVLDEMLRVGDIVRAEVISIGDQSFYYCSTARNDLGVVMAKSEAGNMMFPLSWREMKDPIIGRTELRKVAKPF